MKFGVGLLNWDPFAHHPSLYAKVAEEAEKLGFDSFFVTDHFMRPTGEVPPKLHATLEAWTTLSFIAARTSRIRLLTVVSPAPLRPPAQFAKVIATLDVLSNGRITLGVGAGWDAREFDAYGTWDPAPVRVKKTEEALSLMIRLWTEDKVEFHGKFYDAKGAVLEPKPVQKPHPPIWTGAMRSGMFKLTAKIADGWIPAAGLGATPEFYRDGVRRIREETGKLSRTDKIVMGLMGYFIAPGLDSPLPAISTVDRAVEKLEEYRQGGCEYFAGMFFPPEKIIEMMRSFARDIVPSFA